MRAVEIRKDIPGIDLRISAKKEKDGTMCRRLLGIAHLLDGGSRTEAQKIACLTVNIFRIWIRRFNEQGIEGLRSKKASGRPVKIAQPLEKLLKEKILKGPTPEEGLVRYRIVDIQRFLKEEHGVIMGLSGIWYKLQEFDLTWKTGRQRHPKSSEEAQDVFKKTLKMS